MPMCQTASSNRTEFLHVLRVGTGGDSYDIPVKQWSSDSNLVYTITQTVPGGYAWCNEVCQQWFGPNAECSASPNAMYQCAYNCLTLGGNGCSSQPGVVAYFCPLNTSECSTGTQVSSTTETEDPNVANLITNADQGVLLSFQVQEGVQVNETVIGCIPGPNCNGPTTTYTSNPGVSNSYLATISSGGDVSLSLLNLPGQNGPVQPVLQRADGSYIGNVSTSTGNPMIAFTSSGSTLWTGPNDTPQIASLGGGVIAASGTTYDPNGNVTGQIANMPTQSWLSFAYQVGSIDQVSFEPIPEDLSFWSSVDGNPSGVAPVAVKLQHARVFIPYGLYKQATYQCTVSDDGSQSCLFSAPVIDPQDSQFQKALQGAVPPWKSVMDIRIPATPAPNNATLSNYLTFATATGPVHYPATDEIVAYIGHGIGQPNSPQNGSYESISMGLVFPASQCLWFYNLQPAPITMPLQAPWVFPCQNDPVESATQKPRIIFLGMCGFTTQMLNDWTVNSNTQVIIYPVYSPINTSNELDLSLAGNEFGTFIQSLVGGATIEDALSQMNTQTQTDIAQHKTTLAPTERWSWTYYGNTNLTFTAP
jgi:hypothetical protein